MRIRRTMLAFACAAFVATTGFVACSGGASGYGSDTQGAFLETCVNKEQQPEAICRCTYEKITQQIPFDRYVEIDKQLQKDPTAVPDELLRIVADCGSQVNNSGAPNSSSDSNSSDSNSGRSDNTDSNSRSSTSRSTT
jgi:hypothetical protein